MRKAINLIAIQDKKILLTKKKQVWILPGGKPEAEETDLECLSRELAEELPKLIVIDDFKPYKSFSGKTPHKGDMLEAITYFATVEGEITPSMEITEAGWFNDFDAINLSDITAKIIDALKTDGFI